MLVLAALLMFHNVQFIAHWCSALPSVAIPVGGVEVFVYPVLIAVCFVVTMLILLIRLQLSYFQMARKQSHDLVSIQAISTHGTFEDNLSARRTPVSSQAILPIYYAYAWMASIVFLLQAICLLFNFALFNNALFCLHGLLVVCSPLIR